MIESILDLPLMVMADIDGNVFEHPELRMLGATGRHHRAPRSGEIIDMPRGTDLYILPGRRPVGLNPATASPEVLHAFDGQPVFAVSAFLPPAFTSHLWTAFLRDSNAPALPLYAYTTVGWDQGREQFVTTAVRVDPDPRQDLDNYPDDGTEDVNARQAVAEHPDNRLIEHLAHCCMNYRCPAARNLFLGRYEAPLPTSRACNSRCVGCISLQEDPCIRATQDRITFRPTVEEIVEVALPHLDNVPGAVVSFGQGCEGEPLTEGKLLEGAISAIRKLTDRGTINLNTNGSRPEVMRRLFSVGLDSARISLNSAREDLYNRYFLPVDYTFKDVIRSMIIGSEMGKFVSINYFVFPGLTDEKDEIRALDRLIEEAGLDMIQWRNLNIDPDLYMDCLDWDGGDDCLGMLAVMAGIRQRHPQIRHGYFNPALK
ncbi:MAG: radical SAM protein [bacterium]|nr:MAG: radical SAM protein [bacterium]